MVDLKFDTLEISCHTELSEFGLVKKLTGNFCIGVWKSTYCPYIESATALSLILMMKKSQEFPVFGRLRKGTSRA